MSVGARLCPTCKKTYPVGTSHCPSDGTGLVSADYARLVGQVIDGRYRVIRALGFGGMGCVYYAEHTRLNKAFALKFLLKELTQNSEMSQRFQQEANSMSKLEHPNCVSVFDFGNTSDGLLYLAMEFLEGQDLGKVIQREEKLPVRRAVRIARQVAECLAEAHRMSIIHRDLKPENIMLVRRGEEHDFVKVLDFGLAKILDNGLDDNPKQALTAVGMVHGTPPYMSPEQANGDELDGRSDVYSLGVILYQMVTGKLPFTGKSAVEIMLAHVTQPPPPPRSIRPDLSASVESLILRSLEKDREKRFTDAREMARALLAAEDATEALSQSSLAAVFAPPRRNSSQSLPTYTSQRQMATVIPPSVDRPTPTRLMTTSPVPRQTPGSVTTVQSRQQHSSSSEEYGLGSSDEMATIMERRQVQSPMDLVKTKPLSAESQLRIPSIQKPASLTYEATEAQIPLPEFPQQDKTTAIPVPPSTNSSYRQTILIGTIAASVGLLLALLYFLFLQ